jgi:Dolichyl-phosphate-mannose-protein mannosyltransferase
MRRMPRPSSEGLATPRRLRPSERAGVRLSAEASEHLAPKWSRRRILAWMTVAIVAIGLIWRFARLVAGYPIWYDEAFLALTWMVRDFRGLFQPPEFYQVAPVGFLALEQAMTSAFGPSALSMRMVPFLAGAASLVLFARFAGKCLDRTSALLAVGIFAASYYPARHGAEVKPYAIDLLLALLTIDLGWSLWLDPRSTRHWLTLAGLIAVGVWFSYPLVFVMAGVGMVLAVRLFQSRDRKAALAMLGMGLIALASWLPMYLLVARPQAEATTFYARSETWRGAFPPLDHPGRFLYWFFDVHTGNMMAYPNGGRNVGSLATTLLVLVGCWSLRRHRSALAFLLLSPLLPTFLASLAKRYPYGTSARTMLFMAPSFCLLTGVGAASVIRRFLPSRRKIQATASCIFALGLAIVVTTVGNIAAPFREVSDVENRRVIRELAALSRPDDLWIGYDGIRLHLGDDDLMVRRWVGQSAEIKYNILAESPGPVRWMPERLGKLSHPGRTWLIVHRSGCEEFDETRLDKLQAELDRTLGAPVVHHHRLTPVISVVAYEYPPQTR